MEKIKNKLADRVTEVLFSLTRSHSYLGFRQKYSQNKSYKL